MPSEVENCSKQVKKPRTSQKVPEIGETSSPGQGDNDEKYSPPK
jgi:hypothetical protein